MDAYPPSKTSSLGSPRGGASGVRGGARVRGVALAQEPLQSGREHLVDDAKWALTRPEDVVSRPEGSRDAPRAFEFRRRATVYASHLSVQFRARVAEMHPHGAFRRAAVRLEYAELTSRPDGPPARGVDQRRAVGAVAEVHLAVQHADLKCPWPMRQLRLWSYRAILEDFVEVAPGEFYRDPTRTKFIAATRRDDLLTRAEYDEITEWMTLGATAEEIAVIA